MRRTLYRVSGERREVSGLGEGAGEEAGVGGHDGFPEAHPSQTLKDLKVK